MIALATRLPLPSAFVLVGLLLGAPGPCAAQDPDALARAGTAAIEARRFGDALEAFTGAAALLPAEASFSFGAGVAAFMLGQDDVARVRFERALALDPGYVPAAVWLGDLHYRAGRLDEAISIYETARRRSPSERDLERKLDAWRREHQLQRRFNEARSGHFTALFGAAGHESLAERVVERLEAIHARVGSTLGASPAGPIVVVLYTREQFSEITRLSAWSAAAYDGRIRVPIGPGLDEPGELDRVLSHEFVHALVATIGGRTVPAWLSEGLATVLEPAGSSDVEATLARTGSRPALSDLHRSFVSLSRGDAEIAYASAARAVRRLIEHRGATAIVSLLEDLSAGVPFERAFQQRMTMRYEHFAALLAQE